MTLLPPIETESELSYAYLHAVAAQAGMSCEVSGRQADNIGVDATIRASGKFSENSLLTDLTLDVQLKATIAEPTRRGGKISYFLSGIDRYDRLRKITVNPPRIVVVFFLPSDQKEWLKCSEEELVLRKCAWWVSLRGAPSSDNSSGQTIYLPEDQLFTPGSLCDIVKRLSREEELRYEL